ncbi:RNA 2',3'-cyclic phosphodiesterase [Paenibacillus sp. GCM10028914]|uniref:RNA 2',3'-cyclic phosphodiesterase n=1 Tax=Paenibacillus sp. GCM10028914 TaxID=3273416 RepID=UPI00360CC16C
MNAADFEPVMRLFIAVPLPEVVSNSIIRWRKELGEQMSFRKWVHPQDYHITVQFLGDTQAGSVETVLSSLQAVAAEQKPIELILQGAGVFGLSSSPRILWAGIAGEREELENLQQRVVMAMEPLGFIPEDRPYRPHITVARKFTGGNISTVLLNTGPESVIWKADRLVLFRTNMHSSPMYEVLGELKFES